MPRILGLDLSTHTGWCVMERGTTPLFGTWEAPDEPVGQYQRRFSALFTWLGDMRAMHQFEAVAYECPILIPGRDDTHMLRILTGFPIICETWTGLQKPHRLPCLEVEIRMVKKALTGDAFAHAPSNRDKQKRNMVAAAKALGWKVQNDDEADAGSVAMCGIASLWPNAMAAAAS